MAMRQRVDTKPLVDFDGILTLEERKRILARVDSMFSWVGASIPDRLEADGDVIHLKRTIHDLIMKKELDGSDRKRIRALVRALDRKGKGLRELITSGDISEEQAVEIYEEMRGILRAVSRLRKLESGEEGERIETERDALMRRVDDERLWREYLKKVR
jgi:hypothetical protein